MADKAGNRWGRPAGGKKGWVVTTKDSNGKETSTEFDFVVLATGSFLAPRIPEIKVHDWPLNRFQCSTPVAYVTM